MRLAVNIETVTSVPCTDKHFSGCFFWSNPAAQEVLIFISLLISLLSFLDFSLLKRKRERNRLNQNPLDASLCYRTERVCPPRASRAKY